jgi:hypothetical protein
MQHELYSRFGVGGIAENVIMAKIEDGTAIPFAKEASEIMPTGYRPALETLGLILWRKPLRGLEKNLIYISKSGTVEKDARYEANPCTTVKSVLGMGANMSFTREALGNFHFPHHGGGTQWEQFLGWDLWRRGYNLVFCPEIKVYHLAHGQTLSRFIKNKQTIAMRSAEFQLFFYNLYGLEEELFIMDKALSTVFDFATYLKKMTEDRITNQAKLKGLIYGNLLGITWLISKKTEAQLQSIRNTEGPYAEKLSLVVYINRMVA